MFVSRREDGTIYGRWSQRQFAGQEELADDHPDLVSLVLPRLRESRADEVDVLHARKERHGFVYNAVRFELNDRAQSKIGDMALRAGLAVLGVPGVTWVSLEFVAADNSVVTFEGAADFLPFAVAAANMAQALFAYRTGLKQACRAASSAEELAAIDIEAGWPE